MSSGSTPDRSRPSEHGRPLSVETGDTLPARRIDHVRLALRALGKPFWRLLTGHTISMLGTSVFQFALGVWIVQHSGAALTFSAFVVASTIPALLVLPVAGSVVDRCDRRYVMIIADSVSAIMTVATAILLWREQLQVVHLFIFTAVASTVRCFQEPAYNALLSVLLTGDQIQRASSVMSVSRDALQIAAPTLSGSLLGIIGLSGLVTLDLATFAVGTALVWKTFLHLRMQTPVTMGFRSILDSVPRDFAASTRFFSNDRRMLLLLGYALLQTATIVLASTMVIPLILSNHSARSLGIVLSFGAVGAVCGSLSILVARSTVRPMLAILLADMIVAACVALAGAASSIPVYCALTFTASFAAATSDARAYAVWLQNLPKHGKGGVLGLLYVARLVCICVAVLSAGMLAEWALKPAIEHGWLGPIVDSWLGERQGRELAVLFIAFGSLAFVGSAVGLLHKPLRDLR